MAVAGQTFGIVGALAAFPRRLAAREVERQGGHLRRGVTRRTSHLVFGRGLLAKANEAEIEARFDTEISHGRCFLSEKGFLRLLGLMTSPETSALTRQALIDQSRLSPRSFDFLSLFDAFEHDAEPYSFRDLILARKYAGLIASGAPWSAIARSVYRSRSVASLTALSLHHEGSDTIYVRDAEGLSELDGQLLFDLGTPDDAELEDLFLGPKLPKVMINMIRLPPSINVASPSIRRTPLPHSIAPIASRPVAGSWRLRMTMRAPSSTTRASSRPGSTSPGLWAIVGGSMLRAGTCKKRSNSTATTRMPSSIWRNLNSMPAISARRDAGGRAISNSTTIPNGHEQPPVACSSSTSSSSQKRRAEMGERFLFDGPDDATVTILLAHGAGAPMDSASMTATAKALAEAGFRIARFEFGYMAARRSSEGRKPPPRAETLNPEYRAAVAELVADGPLVIGGKSMGGRVASMVADDLYSAGKIAGLLCLGYPFHPPGKPEQLRTKHLAGLMTPTLICQGTRDEFGTRGKFPAMHSQTESKFSGLKMATMTSNLARASPVSRPPITWRPWPRRS